MQAFIRRGAARLSARSFSAQLEPDVTRRAPTVLAASAFTAATGLYMYGKSQSLACCETTTTTTTTTTITTKTITDDGAGQAQEQGPGAPKNSAFVFVKPHAVTAKTNKTARDRLVEKGFKITGEGDIKSEEIDAKKLIDQHYYAIASKATILTPDQVNVPREKFKAHFGKDWDTLLKNGECSNALDACKFFGCNAAELSKAWGDANKAKKLVKLGGGFYCGEVCMNGKSKYVLNAFFMDMRNKFTAPGGSIHWWTVEWDEEKLSWEEFRGKTLGPTDPKDAPKDSLRGEILKNWQSLGLKSEPNVGDNGMHASASPFEAMSERMNWLNRRCSEDSFCKAMVAVGIPEKTIEEWSVDPQVKLDASGKKGSLYDAVEDMDAKACLAKLKALYALQ